jgi:predicted O-methyltransferase YrrM
MFRRGLGRSTEKRPLSLRLYERFLRKYHSHDIGYELQMHARRESAAYVRKHMPSAMMFRGRWDLLDAALDEAPRDGLVLEFGVEKGASANFIARRLHERGSESVVHAFDSFEGLPGEWSGTFERKGKFSLGGRLPSVLPNVRLHKGWFEETLPLFMRDHPGNLSLVHIDCDIYSSTREVLGSLRGRIQPGTVIVFDEYFNYHNWQRHEFMAWREFVEQEGITYSYRGFAARGGQVYIRVI